MASKNFWSENLRRETHQPAMYAASSSQALTFQPNARHSKIIHSSLETPRGRRRRQGRQGGRIDKSHDHSLGYSFSSISLIENSDYTPSFLTPTQSSTSKTKKQIQRFNRKTNSTRHKKAKRGSRPASALVRRTDSTGSDDADRGGGDHNNADGGQHLVLYSHSREERSRASRNEENRIIASNFHRRSTERRLQARRPCFGAWNTSTFLVEHSKAPPIAQAPRFKESEFWVGTKLNDIDSELGPGYYGEPVNHDRLTRKIKTITSGGHSSKAFKNGNEWRMPVPVYDREYSKVAFIGRAKRFHDKEEKFGVASPGPGGYDPLYFAQSK